MAERAPRSQDVALDDAIASELDDATMEEAAAILSAITAHVSDRERAAAVAAGATSQTGGPTWEGRRWTFAGRLDRTHQRGQRVPTDVPGDAWSAAGRSDRY